MTSRKTSLSRRAMLAAFGTVACAPRLSTEPPPVSPVFPLGLASGEPTSDGAIVWTRYTGAAQLTLRVWREDAEASTARALPVEVDANGFVHAPVTGLTAGAWHRFQFTEVLDGSEVGHSEIGRFRTAFPPDVAPPLRLGAVSCTHQKYPLDTLLQAAARDDLDAFLVLGDFLYADGAETSEEYRAIWDEALGRHPHQRLRAKTSLIAAWDDHEVVDNFDAELTVSALVNEGRERFFEYQPVRPSAASPGRIWRSLRWGKTAEIFVLDCRGERRPGRGEYVSREQLDWLKQGLATSPCAFKLILNSVPITEFPGPLFGLQLHDRWEGFPAQRTELLEHIDSKGITGVLWVSGDFHLGTVGRVSRQGPGSKAIEALVGPGGQRANTSPTYPSPPQFDFATGVNNYVLIDLDPATVTARLQYVSGSGKIVQDRSYALG
ncbi:MAG: alkaline phosphatase D family protein [Myxococcaceae bacterium]|nr:alkaline phosphatase D family protein [Myxococcaceae bacterium]